MVFKDGYEARDALDKRTGGGSLPAEKGDESDEETACPAAGIPDAVRFRGL